MNNPIKPLKDAADLTGELIRLAGDNPDVKEAGKNLGKTALTITKTINNALLPLAAVNFAFDKARAYFVDKFQDDLSKKASVIPPEHIVEPKASIAGPVLQGLAFTHEEPNLRDMYLSLLATAMDERSTNDAHPAFVEFIKQLNSEEAALLRDILLQDNTPTVEIQRTTTGATGYVVITKHLLNLCDSQTGNPIENPRVPAMVDNWIRLGLVEVDYSKRLIDENNYRWVEQRPEYIRYCQQMQNDTERIRYHRGIITRTALGIQFSRAVGLLENSAETGQFGN